jgi:thiamine kinase-like enzyme
VGDLEHILAQLQPVLGDPAGDPVALDGGITNRNFRATLGGSEYVIRLHGKDTDLLGIDREAERAANVAAAALGLAPAVAARMDQGLVTRFIRCAPLDSAAVAGRVQEIARALRSFHDCGVALPVRFWVPGLLADYERVVRARGGELPAAYAETVSLAQRIAAALPAQAPRPCHNDLLPGNIIRPLAQDRVMIVDWEYAGMGHPFFDLGNLSVNNGFGRDADERLLAAYGDAPPSDSERAVLQLMRVLSDAREAAWGVVQGRISELDFDFDGYARRHFERLLGAAAQPDFEEWLAAA